MNALDAARAHLAKAREFLEAAELENRADLYNAATSSAVVSGINSKDAICLKLTGRTSKSDDHAAAVGDLAASSAQGRQLGPTFKRLLSKKAKSQYQDQSVAATEARKAIEQATKLYRAAREIVTS
jgi:uncharacterized protein (UPF0332 family)